MSKEKGCFDCVHCNRIVKVRDSTTDKLFTERYRQVDCECHNGIDIYYHRHTIIKQSKVCPKYVQMSVEEMRKYVNQLQSDINRLNNTITELRSENDRLRKANETLRRDNKSLLQKDWSQD